MLKRFAHDEKGGTITEFVIVAPLFFMFFFWVFEIGIVLTKWSMLERGLDLTIRELRTNKLTDSAGNLVDLDSYPETEKGNQQKHDLLRESVCRNSRILKDCTTLMYLELTEVNVGGTNIPGDKAECVNRVAPVSTRPAINSGAAGLEGMGSDTFIFDEVIYVRACYWIDPIMPLGFRILGVTSEVKDPKGKVTTNQVYKHGFALTAKSSYVNEPI